jgi:hypothetical protein
MIRPPEPGFFPLYQGKAISSLAMARVIISYLGNVIISVFLG